MGDDEYVDLNEVHRKVKENLDTIIYLLLEYQKMDDPTNEHTEAAIKGLISLVIALKGYVDLRFTIAEKLAEGPGEPIEGDEILQ